MNKTIATIAMIAVFCAAFCVGCGDEANLMPDTSFVTKDGVTIFAGYTLPKGAKKAVILVHDKGTDHSVWADLTPKLHEAGYATLAIDLRGHGQSLKQGEKTLDYKDFTDTWTGEEGKTWMMDCYKDVEAGIKFLESNGFATANIAAIGEGEGADILTQYRGQHPAPDGRIVVFVLLSPEIRDYGSTIKNVGPIEKLDEKIFLYYCNNDTDCGEYEGSKMFKKMSAIAAKYKSELRQELVARRYEGTDHGVAILKIANVTDRITQDLDSLLD